MIKNKINVMSIWRFATLAVFAVCWLVLVRYMRLSEWWLVPVYAGYLLINAVVFRYYVMGSLGTFYLAAGRTDTAMRLYRRAVEKNTRNEFATYQYAVEILKEGNAAYALTLLERARKTNPKLILEKNIVLAMGSCYWVLGDIDKAIETLETLRKDYTYVNAHVLTTLGFLYALQGDDERALLLTNQALEDDPAHAAAWDNLGQLYYKQDNLPKAEEAFLKALSYKETMVDSLFFMGLIREKQRDTAGAGAYFEKADACHVSALSTVTKEQIERKWALYRSGFVQSKEGTE